MVLSTTQVELKCRPNQLLRSKVSQSRRHVLKQAQGVKSYITPTLVLTSYSENLAKKN